MTNQNPGEAETTSSLKIAAAWIFVGIPLLWGVSQTLINAMQLFK
jgi:hypothetical protein